MIAGFAGLPLGQSVIVPEPGHLVVANGLSIAADGGCEGDIEMRYGYLSVQAVRRWSALVQPDCSIDVVQAQLPEKPTFVPHGAVYAYPSSRVWKWEGTDIGWKEHHVGGWIKWDYGLTGVTPCPSYVARGITPKNMTMQEWLNGGPCWSAWDVLARSLTIDIEMSGTAHVASYEGGCVMDPPYYPQHWQYVNGGQTCYLANGEWTGFVDDEIPLGRIPPGLHSDYAVGAGL